MSSQALDKTYQTFNFNKPCYNHFHNILRLSDVLPNFLFTTSETITIIIYKDGISVLSHELPNDLKL